MTREPEIRSEPAKSLTLRNTILRAATALPDGSFSAEDLTVQAFLMAPEIVAMNGHPHFPDHHRVYAALCGRRGIVEKGYLERLATGQYMLTELGRSEVGANIVHENVPENNPNDEEVKMWKMGNLTGACWNYMCRMKSKRYEINGLKAIQAFQELAQE